jgi:hypothetical protein
MSEPTQHPRMPPIEIATDDDLRQGVKNTDSPGFSGKILSH